MKFHSVLDIKIDIRAGATIYTACRESLLVCQKLNHPVYFDFNGRNVHVVPGDSIDELLDAWTRACGNTHIDKDHPVIDIRTGRELSEPKKTLGKPKLVEAPKRPTRRIVL